MEHFTPVSALAGGLLIGAAAILLLGFNGRIAGVSGVLGGLWGWRPSERTWRVLFLIGLIVGAGAWNALVPGAGPREGLAPPWLVLAGLLTGWGTSMANGCTSGHGVCGLARFSLRSLLATVVFLLVAVLTTWLTRHVWGLAT